MNGAAAPPPRATSFRAGCLGVALVALVAWWPLSAYWQSDDFLAVTYAADWRRALADFTGNQYGTPALVWFYRPLITLSFAIDAWLGGADPFVAHCSNVVAHAVSTVLVALLGRRLLGAGPGLGLALLFSLWPAHAGSILWAVGRVDSHTTMWILLACFATVRWLDSGRGRTLALGAFALALLSKELAFVTPVLAGLLGFALGAPGARVRRAWQAAWPLLVLFAVYLVWRRIVLGRFVGGYQDAAFEPVAAIVGLGTWLVRLGNPLLGLDGAGKAAVAAGFLLWPLALFAAHRRGRARAVAGLLAGFVVCALPTAPFWALTDEVRNLRYFYLPAACLLAVVAAGGAVPVACAVLLLAPALVQVRAHYRDAHRHAGRAHAALLQADATLPPGDLLVAGLPRQNDARDVLLFHLFVDRLLLPPFGSGRPVRALRPLIERPGVLTVPESAFAALPGTHGLALDGEARASALPPAPPLPVLPVEVEGSLYLSAQAMWDLHRGRTRAVLRFPGDRSPHYRVTVLTGGGYLACVLRNATPEASAGEVPVTDLLIQGRYATEGSDAVLVHGLAVPSAIDVTPAFPILVEGGEAPGGDPRAFVAHSRAARLLELRVDRDYCEWLAGRIGDRHASK